MDCLEGMKSLDDNSVDSIVTDPPYEWGFMDKKWDSTGIAYNVELWKECLRVLKPGGHLLAFGGTRTYHRMTCAIEEAGFEIRDCIQWLYGTGFPKSHDISKAIDKKLGTYVEGKLLPSSRTTGASATGIATTFRKKTASNPQAPEAQEWDGWGTALKPANEPIVLARKPLSEKTIADNVLKWGTGGINIDDCRIELQEEGEDKRLGGKGTWKTEKMAKNVYKGGYSGEGVTSSKLGRFPANVILDEEAGRMLDEQHKGASRFFYCAKASKKERNMGLEDMPEVISNDGRDETLASGNMPHNRGNVPKKNHHPTVKPIKLMEYLITLITPPNGIVLDPFFGSGTTGIAAANLGFNYIGFEISKEYCIIAEKRISQMKRAIKRVEKIG
jgi:site-specific DNA-methyltransferase (adenine-specific)